MCLKYPPVARTLIGGEAGDQAQRAAPGAPGPLPRRPSQLGGAAPGREEALQARPLCGGWDKVRDPSPAPLGESLEQGPLQTISRGWRIGWRWPSGPGLHLLCPVAGSGPGGSSVLTLGPLTTPISKEKPLLPPPC